MADCTLHDKQKLSYEKQADDKYAQKVVLAGDSSVQGFKFLFEKYPGMDSDLTGTNTDIYSFYADSAKTDLQITLTITYSSSLKEMVVGYEATGPGTA